MNRRITVLCLLSFAITANGVPLIKRANGNEKVADKLPILFGSNSKSDFYNSLTKFNNMPLSDTVVDENDGSDGTDVDWIYLALRDGDSNVWDKYGVDVADIVSQMLNDKVVNSAEEAIVRLFYPELTDNDAEELITDTDSILQYVKPSESAEISDMPENPFFDFVMPIQNVAEGTAANDKLNFDTSAMSESQLSKFLYGDETDDEKRNMPISTDENEDELLKFLSSLKIEPNSLRRHSELSSKKSPKDEITNIKPTTETISTTTPVTVFPESKRGQPEFPIYAGTHEMKKGLL